MKNGNFIAAALVLGALVSPALTPASAQTALEKRAEIEARYGVKDAVVKYDTRADMMKEPYRTGAEYFMYPMERPEMTAAPKGYKPFYISYTGRHGARYAIKDEVYELISSIEEPDIFADTVAMQLDVKVAAKQEVLEAFDVKQRLQIVNRQILEENQILAMERDISERVQEAVKQNQKEYILREQMKVIRYTMKTALICNCRMLIVWITRMSC